MMTDIPAIGAVAVRQRRKNAMKNETQNDTQELVPTSEPMTGRGTLIAALAKAQAEFGAVEKDATNPHFRSKYATLHSALKAVLPALNKHGIALVQCPMKEGIETQLLMGEHMISCWVPIVGEPKNMQQFGSAVTYARRYGLMMACGLAPSDAEDDDGTAAVQAPKPDREQTKAKLIARIEACPANKFAEMTDFLAGTQWLQDEDVRAAYMEREHDLSGALNDEG